MRKDCRFILSTIAASEYIKTIACDFCDQVNCCILIENEYGFRSDLVRECLSALKVVIKPGNIVSVEDKSIYEPVGHNGNARIGDILNLHNGASILHHYGGLHKFWDGLSVYFDDRMPD